MWKPLRLDIRDTVKYKEVMKQYGLGPNGGIVTSLNLFATRFDQVRFIKCSYCSRVTSSYSTISTAVNFTTLFFINPASPTSCFCMWWQWWLFRKSEEAYSVVWDCYSRSVEVNEDLFPFYRLWNLLKNVSQNASKLKRMLQQSFNYEIDF